MSFHQDVATAAKLANVSKVFEAASLLHLLGLQTESPADTLRRYIEANPDINDFVSRHPDGQLPSRTSGE